MESRKSVDEELSFKKLTGHIIPDPFDAIRQLNRRAKSVTSSFFVYADNKKLDYKVEYAAANIGLVELWGHRETQEDSYALGQIKAADFTALSSDTIKKIHADTVAFLSEWILLSDITLREYMGKNESISGSTQCSVLIAKNKIYTTSLGDSAAYLCCLDQNANVSEFRRLNTLLHNPSSAEEALRITQQSKNSTNNAIINNRLNGQLAVSRSYGDAYFERYGLSHEPDVYIDDVVIPEGGKAFVVVACDGLTECYARTERPVLSESDIAELINMNQYENVSNIAKVLAERAKARGSMDNISVAVTQIDPQAVDAKYIAIFDGHGGDQVSAFLQQHYSAVYKLFMYMALLQQCSPQLMLSASDAGDLQNEMQKLYKYVQNYLSFVRHEYVSSIDKQDYLLECDRLIVKCSAILEDLWICLRKSPTESNALHLRELQLCISKQNRVDQVDQLIEKYCPELSSYPRRIPAYIYNQFIAPAPDVMKEYDISQFEDLFLVTGLVFSLRREMSSEIPCSFDFDRFNSYLISNQSQSGDLILLREAELCVKQYFAAENHLADFSQWGADLVVQLKKVIDEYVAVYHKDVPSDQVGLFYIPHSRDKLIKLTSIVNQLEEYLRTKQENIRANILC